MEGSYLVDALATHIPHSKPVASVIAYGTALKTKYLRRRFWAGMMFLLADFFVSIMDNNLALIPRH